MRPTDPSATASLRPDAGVSAEERPGPTTVLLADDSTTQLRLVQRLLEGEGFRVITASDGVEGVNRAYSDAPDVIVSDVVMPELNGYQFCRLIKNDWFT